MKRLILTPLTFFLLSAWAEANFTEGHLQRLNSLKNPQEQDFEHEFPGCPANSHCTEQTGVAMGAWLKKIKSMENYSTAQKHKELQSRLESDGLPVQFLVPKSAWEKEKASSMLWSTHCPQHRTKEEGPIVFKAIAFLKRISSNDGKIFPKVIIHTDKGEKTFFIPNGEVPLMIKNYELVLGQESEDFFYHITVSENGLLHARYQEAKLLQQAVEMIQTAECPSKMQDQFFADTICKKILDANSGKTVLMQMQWACP